LLALLLALRLGLLLQQDDRGHEAYDAGAFADAQQSFARNGILVPVERWVAPFNEGDARFRLGDHTGAAEAFQAALPLAPPERECSVRLNLALTLEAAGDASLEEGERNAAEASWQRGLESLGACPLDESDAWVEETARAETRLVEKLGGQPPSASEPPVPPPADEETARKERELEEKNERAREERRRSEQDDAPRAPVPHW
jgi:tetratricopeptide (TPR) repeat protein